jgi:hypothetical protein
MIEFSAILATLDGEREAFAEERAQTAFAQTPPSTRPPGAASAHRAARAYSQQSATQDAPARGAARPLDMREFLGELRRARGSTTRLKALRRELAWRCHPDRLHDPDDESVRSLMAEYNARIDAELAQCATPA